MPKLVNRAPLRLQAGLVLLHALAALQLLASLAGPRCAGAEERFGIELRLDTQRYELAAHDLATGEVWPAVRVVAGSPGSPTPHGRFAVDGVVLKPGWVPGRKAAAAGAEPEPPSFAGPMGVAKLPFAQRGVVALHGGGNALLLGFPVSSGCVRMRDGDLLRLLSWLDLRGALAPPRMLASGSFRRALLRPLAIEVR